MTQTKRPPEKPGRFTLLIELIRTGDPELQAYANELLFRQTGERYLNAWHHVQPAWYYLKVMATLWLPGVLFLPWLARAWWRDIRQGEPKQILLLLMRAQN